MSAPKTFAAYQKAEALAYMKELINSDEDFHVFGKMETGLGQSK